VLDSLATGPVTGSEEAAVPDLLGSPASVTTAPEDVPEPSSAPIGVFDSGFGGLTVARAIVDQLPHEDIIYLGDTAHAPYGPRSIAEVRRYALACLDELAGMGVKALVIACNTASSAVLADARERYSIPVVDVVVPAAKQAVRVSRSGHVAVLCTEATATSGSYDNTVTIAPGATLTTIVCPRFVEFVEAGVTSGPELLDVAREYLAPLIGSNVDTVILGCTHYPLLSGVISYVLGGEVTLVSSASACADETYATLTRAGLVRHDHEGGTKRFLTTGEPERFAAVGRRLIGDLIGTAESVDLSGLTLGERGVG
jgi:glutamate racemase